MNVACTDTDAGKGGVTSRVQGPLPPFSEQARAARATERIECAVRQCVLKMADGLCTGEPVDDVIEVSLAKGYPASMAAFEATESASSECAKVNPFYLASASDKLFDKFDGRDKHQGFLPCEEDCRKKRCVDRYDSSESSDRFVDVDGAPRRSLSWPLP